MIAMSQETLAEALGLTFQQVQKYEKGVNRIGASRLLGIARMLGVGVDYFFEDLPDLPLSPSRPDTHMQQFLTLPESDRLVRDFVRLKDADARRRVADLVEWMAGVGADKAAV
ncbi:helix-turn-helix domain-containing protein [Microvirga sp. 2MCAF38]|uniref:helix-turn-helix domain-containing protein n=1 Tax=Microvirga sp. 2MCAF38 TaxID=3232989 RepID=UPI003F977AEA